MVPGTDTSRLFFAICESDAAISSQEVRCGPSWGHTRVNKDLGMESQEGGVAQRDSSLVELFKPVSQQLTFNSNHEEQSNCNFASAWNLSTFPPHRLWDLCVHSCLSACKLQGSEVLLLHWFIREFLWMHVCRGICIVHAVSVSIMKMDGNTGLWETGMSVKHCRYKIWNLAMLPSFAPPALVKLTGVLPGPHIPNTRTSCWHSVHVLWWRFYHSCYTRVSLTGISTYHW